MGLACRYGINALLPQRLDFFPFDIGLLERAATRITNEVRWISRVVL
jgi:hypothetical protein